MKFYHIVLALNTHICQKDVKHTLNQMYNDRLKAKRKKRKVFNKRKRRHKDFTNHIHNKKSSYGKRNITDTKEEKQ